MNITCFDDLLLAARQQSEPQRLLLVFAAAELPDDATPTQRAGFEAGEGGALAPRMCVDKRPEELASFAALVQEAEQFGTPWGLLVAAALAGSGTQPPSDDATGAALERMVEDVQRGQFQRFLVFDTQGQAVQLG